MISVNDYHQRTKHSLERYARGPETLDWDDQPDPFRRFDGCPIQALPSPGRELSVSWAELDDRKNVPAAELNLANVGLLLELSFGLSAWKQFGPDRWALRCNPSSGNLHPSEAYLINGVAGLMPHGVYHYVSHDHHLERRCRLEQPVWQDTLLLGLSSVHWREAWKYGERAFRYCQLDAGHALAALSYAAAALGWRIELLGRFNDAEISACLGVDRAEDFIEREKETADWLCRIDYNARPADSTSAPAALVQTLKQAPWQGKARSLGAYHMYVWPVIEEVAVAAERQLADSEQRANVSRSVSTALDCPIPVTRLLRQRRSAQHFNGRADAIGTEVFTRMLVALLPGEHPPFDAWNWSPAVHLCLFVHKVEGLVSGIYCLPRSESGLVCLQQTLNPEFLWREQPAFPGLYLLYEADVRKPAKTLSCHQAIASDSAFSLAMLTEFRTAVAQQAWHYRRLFWECGLLGQILYLEAEAAGLRGTGIGCFFDDDVHGVLGIKDDTLQSLYHFTVGEPLTDDRIQTLPAYAHLADR